MTLYVLYSFSFGLYIYSVVQVFCRLLAMLAHKIRKFSSDTRFVVHIFKKLLEKIVIILRNNLVNIDKFDTFAPDIAENYVLQQHEQQKLRILYRLPAL